MQTIFYERMDTKKLRQKILDLAIHGKLVPQDPNDEPASVLLERIRAEKERLIKEGKIKRSKKSAASDTPHYENDVPSNWTVCRLEDIAVIGTGATPDTRIDAYYIGNIPWINSSSTKGEYIEIPSSYISEKAISETNCQIYPSGSLIMAMYGEGKTRGQVSELCFDSATNQACAAIVPIDNQMKGFLKTYLKSKYYHIRTLAEGGNQPNLNLSKISQYIIPIPPIDEQVRIIAAIEKWFALIETLETAKDDLQASIVQAKSKILDLAIHGKLVPQDPNDEPAIELLKRINPKFTPCDNAHDTNRLPSSWCWTTLGDVCELVTGSTPSKLHPEYYGGDFPFYKPSDLDAGRHVNIPSEFLTDEGKIVSRIIPVGSTAICCIGSIGKCGYIEKEGTTNQQINTAVPSKALNPLYLYFFCNSSYFIDELSADSSAITISIVNKSKLSKMLISLPPYNEQQHIVAKIEELFVVLDEIQKSIEA